MRNLSSGVAFNTVITKLLNCMDMPQASTWNRTCLTALIVGALGAAMLRNLQAQQPAALQQQAAPTAKPGSLVAIADLHGDVDKAINALQLLNVVDNQGRWSAEGITVVQVGWLDSLCGT